MAGKMKMCTTKFCFSKAALYVGHTYIRGFTTHCVKRANVTLCGNTPEKTNSHDC